MNMAIFHFKNIHLSPVIFTLGFLGHKQTHDVCIHPYSFAVIAIAICHLLSMQLLPTLDIYTWTEEHVVSISVFNVPGSIYILIAIQHSYSILICDYIILSVFLDAANIWCRFVYLFSHISHYKTIFKQTLAPSHTLFVHFPSQGRVHVKCSCTPTCLKKITSLERGCYCSQKTTCGTWGSSLKVTSCTLRQGIVNH